MLSRRQHIGVNVRAQMPNFFEYLGSLDKYDLANVVNFLHERSRCALHILKHLMRRPAIVSEVLPYFRPVKISFHASYNSRGIRDADTSVCPYQIHPSAI